MTVAVVEGSYGAVLTESGSCQELILSQQSNFTLDRIPGMLVHVYAATTNAQVKELVGIRGAQGSSYDLEKEFQGGMFPQCPLVPLTMECSILCEGTYI